MKTLFFIFAISGLSMFAGTAFCSSSYDYIEINLDNRKIRLVDFCLGSCKINGDFFFALSKKNGLLTLGIEGRNITFVLADSACPFRDNSSNGIGNKFFDDGRESFPFPGRQTHLQDRVPMKFEDGAISWIKMELTKNEDTIFVNYFSLPQFTARGRVDLKKDHVVLDIDSVWQRKAVFLETQIKMKAKCWGGISNFFTTGCLTVEDGKYKGNDFFVLRLDFLGKPPLFNITDSKIILKNGNVFKITGILDLRNFSDFMPGVEFAAQKISFDGWQLISEDKRNVGFKKNIADKLDVFLNTDKQQNDDAKAGTELRYNYESNKFLKLRIQKDKTILGLEQRRYF